LNGMLNSIIYNNKKIYKTGSRFGKK